MMLELSDVKSPISEEEFLEAKLLEEFLIWMLISYKMLPPDGSGTKNSPLLLGDLSTDSWPSLTITDHLREAHSDGTETT